ncbi:hypothetical protein [Dyadobacter pollutisoli]|jgi:hypothetical protein|uniref:Uncharacterized protein n=1 Tax=Dyadobacter pollutisoli TaxID=2910158 RepID=A0A9E8SKE4_9BACT|nr:hypothetical protein [Dyadobacter pollutisoli]WAC11898.1 hypothetical protein ON006_29725 [Dyadobacter pollutisoli]
MDNDNIYPPGYDDLDKLMRDAKAQIQQIEIQINNAERDKGPQNRLDPPGYGKGTPANPQKTIADLKQEIEGIKTSTLSAVEKRTKGIDPKMSKGMREKSLNELYPNTFEGMDKKEMEAQRGKPKDLEVSQDFVDAQIKDHKKMEAEKENMVAKGTESQKEKPMSMSARFSQSLGYTKTLNEADLARGKDKSAEMPTAEAFSDNKKEVVEKDKPLSMSANFTQSLGYNKMKQGAETAISKSPVKSPNKGGMDRD